MKLTWVCELKITATQSVGAFKHVTDLCMYFSFLCHCCYVQMSRIK